MPFVTPGSPKTLLAPVKATFKKCITTTEMAALKSEIEGLWSDVGVTYDGVEFDYDVVITGSSLNFSKAMKLAMPVSYAGVIRQGSQY
jgi:hypothetical protein